MLIQGSVLIYKNACPDTSNTIQYLLISFDNEQSDQLSYNQVTYKVTLILYVPACKIIPYLISSLITSQIYTFC